MLLTIRLLVLQLPTTSGAKKMLESSLCSSVCMLPSKHAMSCGHSTTVGGLSYQSIETGRNVKALTVV